MAIRRGTLYRVPAFSRADGVLVLTNDEWNDAPTEQLSGALVYVETGPGRTPIPDTGLYAGPLLRVLKAGLTDAILELASGQLAPVENAVSEILGLGDLLDDPPRAPGTLPGLIDYPRWSNVYYAGERVGDPPERKRYLVVSHDQYNRALGGAVCVRTTTSERRGGPTIPTLHDGQTKALCVLPTFYASQSVDLRGPRPRPAQVFTADMRTIAVGLREALVLPGPAARRSDGA